MKRILLLGGTGDALRIVREFAPPPASRRGDDFASDLAHESGSEPGSESASDLAHDRAPAPDASLVYSLAGLGKVPDDLACEVRVGGFGGSEGLARYLADQRIGLVVDATHPYAARISANAAEACRIANVRCWALRRPGWQPQAGDDWRMVDDWDALTDALASFRKPFFTLGREPLAHLDEIPVHQFWTVRCLDPHADTTRSRVLASRGPFTLEGERALFALQAFDVVVSKNSGGSATEAKLAVARERGLPVVMLRRPDLPKVEREFESVDTLLDALRAFA